ncbi:hypothetical protein C8F04DRAFT_1402565 [Mycena alexandri]|uniref:Uncharacterized protein n=1 Tax=Mycena alexandri TaxID=1745969 RepID=A0AAD6S6J8_9AGAR|nr:hypothetical protein C8F04DRAFT_1402565 [Mycena alexandri]
MDISKRVQVASLNPTRDVRKRMICNNAGHRCPECHKKFKKGCSQKIFNDHKGSKACREARDLKPRTVEPIPPPPAALECCAGIPLPWDPATFWETYPFHVHSPSAKHPSSYNLVLLEPAAAPRARSKDCLGTAISPNGACAKCSALNLDISIIEERASRSFELIHDHSDLNAPQLRAKVELLKDNLNTLKLKNLDLKEAVDSTRERLKEYVNLIQFMGQHSHEIFALHRLLANAVANGWGANIILEHCLLSIAGKYTARNYTLYEIYLAILIYELGGGGALHALNHSIFALPSRNTIQPYRSQSKLMPSVNGVRGVEISSNISALFGPRSKRENDTEKASPMIYGHTLSFDEVATDRRIDYMDETDDMAGLCLEHLPALKTVKVGTDTTTVEAAVTAVRNGDVHISHETSVGAISRLSETGYGARPVFMGPSCKTGDWKESLRTMEIVVEAWKRSEYGERLHGPILSIASDSDAKRCLALFMMTMHTEIIEGNPLYPFIRDLPGLNRRVGKDNLTMDPDYKHKFKGMRTLLTSNAGLLVKNTCINRDLLFSWLERLTDHDWSETTLHALLDPADGQNVSATIKLFLAIIELTSLDKADFDPNEAIEFEALCLLAELLNAWIQPYINTDLTLSEQIESLVFLREKCGFKAKMRVINGELKVFICLLGDDVLEALFGRARMIGGHSPNCSVAELLDRFMSAMNLDWIYEQCPEFEKQPRRLNLKRMRHVDHLRPRHFKRELRAKSCDLPVVWKSAVRKAEAILAKYGVQMAVPFAVLFKRPETDLLRPYGGKYPALSNKADRSVAESSAVVIDSTVDARCFNSSVLIPPTEMDRIFAEIESSDTSPRHSVFADINDNGRQAHKKTIVRTFFEMTHDIHTSRDRLLRVRGFTYGGKSWTRENGEGHQTISATSHFKQGHLFTTLICYNNTHIALAIAKCTMIRKTGSKTASTSAVPRGELNLPESVWTISGQTLSLVPLDQHRDTPGFEWDGEFVSLSLNKKGQNGDVSRIRNLQFSVPSRLVDVAIHEQAHELLAVDSEAPCTREKTWFFSNKDVSAAFSRLWERLLADKTMHDKFPVFTEVSNGVFPYVTPASLDSPAIHYFKPIAGTPIEETHFNRSTCRVCGVVVKDTNRQTHVGQHILKSICGVNDPSVKLPVSKAYPCGTCGGPTINGGCTTGVKNGKLDSNCPLTYSFMISAAAQFREKRPCTNIPIKCPLADCHQFHWKYNFQQHLQDRHPQWRAILSKDFLSTIQISSAEREALGVPLANIIRLPAAAPPNPVFPPPSHGQKRPASSPPSSPSRRSNKENDTPKSDVDSRTERASKVPKLFF